MKLLQKGLSVSAAFRQSVSTVCMLEITVIIYSPTVTTVSLYLVTLVVLEAGAIVVINVFT